MLRLILSIAFITFATSMSFAESPDSPPDLAFSRNKQWFNNVEVEQSYNIQTDIVRLRVSYHLEAGIFSQTDGPLFVWIRLNGREGLFPMEYIGGRDGGRFELNLSNRPYNCKLLHFIHWVCMEPSPEMADLFFWARRTDVDGVKRLNVWDLELAFKSQNSEWDSRNGRNYYFRFNE